LCSGYTSGINFTLCKHRNYNVTAMIKTTLYRFIQLTWGFPQTAAGFILWLWYSVKQRDHDGWNNRCNTAGRNNKCNPVGQCGSTEHGHSVTDRLHFSFKGAFGTFWDRDDGVSLGMFIFVPGDADEHMIVHEYAHTIQSLVLGPLYLPVVGLCSMIWNRNPSAGRGWRSGKASYYDFFTERWAENISSRLVKADGSVIDCARSIAGRKRHDTGRITGR
jgi:hypothetical protein